MERLRNLAIAWHRRVLADEVVSHAFSHRFHPEHVERLAAYRLPVRSSATSRARASSADPIPRPVRGSWTYDISTSDEMSPCLDPSRRAR